MGNRQSSPDHQYPSDHQEMDPYPEPMQDSGRQRRGFFASRRSQQAYPDSAPPVPPKQPYKTYLSSRPHIQVHRPLPPSSSYNPTDPAPPPLEPLQIPLTSSRPNYTPKRFLHPEPTVRLPKPGTWIMGTIRSGGAGLKRGEVDRGTLKEGLREVRAGRKEAREAERLRRYDDACREYSALKIQTEQDIYRSSRKGRGRARGRQDHTEEAYAGDPATYGYPAQEAYYAPEHAEYYQQSQAPTEMQTEAYPVQPMNYGNIPSSPAQPYSQTYSEPQAEAYGGDPSYDQTQSQPQPQRGRSIWKRSHWVSSRAPQQQDQAAESQTLGNIGTATTTKTKRGFRSKHGMRHVDREEVHEY